MNQSENPYRAPLVDNLDASHRPCPSEVIPGRFAFSGEVTLAHHRDAVMRAGIRPEYRRVFRVGSVMALISLIFALLLMIRGLTPDTIIRSTVSVALFLVTFWIFLRPQWTAYRDRLPSYQLTRGPINGWIDSQRLHVETQHYQANYPIESLVSCATTYEIAALSFGTDHTYWQTLPMDAFEFPAQARAMFADLQRIRRPSPAVFIDPRRQQPPEDSFRFEPTGESIHFDGPTEDQDRKGTRFEDAVKRILYHTWAVTAIFLGGMFTSVVVGFQLSFSMVMLTGFWFALLGLFIFVRIWIARRRNQTDTNAVTWYSKGWIDQKGYCAMTRLGQTQMDWEFFDHHEITERAIAFYPHATDVCCCLIARSQFSDDESWQKAVKIVNQYLG